MVGCCYGFGLWGCCLLVVSGFVDCCLVLIVCWDVGDCDLRRGCFGLEVWLVLICLYLIWGCAWVLFFVFCLFVVY